MPRDAARCKVVQAVFLMSREVKLNNGGRPQDCHLPREVGDALRVQRYSVVQVKVKLGMFILQNSDKALGLKNGKEQCRGLDFGDHTQWAVGTGSWPLWSPIQPDTSVRTA